jgi:hypothetical protein
MLPSSSGLKCMVRNWIVYWIISQKPHAYFDFNAKVGREDILNPQSGMTVYMKLLMLMLLE